MKRAAVTLVVLICACGATSAQAATKHRSIASCHKAATRHHGHLGCRHGKRPAPSREVQELVWEAAIDGPQPTLGALRELVTEDPLVAGEPARAQARKEAAEEAQEAREEAQEAAKERAEELG